jgi:hypothetical protein
MTEDNEYKDIRENLKDLIQKGQEAIDEVKKLTEDGDTFKIAADKELTNPDEFLLDNVKAYHYEVMEEGSHVWMGFYFENHKTGHLNIFLKDGKIHTRYEEWDGP